MNLIHSKKQTAGRFIKMEPKNNIKTAFIEDER